MNYEKKGLRNEKLPSMFPIEGDLKDYEKRHRICDDLVSMLGDVQRLLRGGLDSKKFQAFSCFQKSLECGIRLIRNFRG
jgi:hypothetical protein